MMPSRYPRPPWGETRRRVDCTLGMIGLYPFELLIQSGAGWAGESGIFSSLPAPIANEFGSDRDLLRYPTAAFHCRKIAGGLRGFTAFSARL